MVWLSGGPGCSSQLALLAENGPCVPNEDGSDTISNKWSWTNKANVIWVRNPPELKILYVLSVGCTETKHKTKN